MRKYKKKEIFHTVEALLNANDAIRKTIKSDPSTTLDTLAACQELGILIGTYLESLGGRCGHMVRLLEEYCEHIYQVSANISDEGLYKGLLERIRVLLTELEQDVWIEVPDDRKEIVFLPYKVSMWDSLESIWRAADEDKDVDAVVIPIPYYSKNPDGSFEEEHYEGDRYPSYVPVVDYRDYNFQEKRPDVIFIHNPYDAFNRVTSIPPFFYSDHLKEYTDKLVYIPYYVVPWSIPEHFVLTPGVISADIIFVQSESIKKQYVKLLETKLYHGESRRLEKKIAALGSPKTDKLLLEINNRAEMPETWKQRIGNRRVVFFNTNVSLILNNGAHFIDNLYRIFHVFAAHRDKFVLLWREHPLTMETLHSMHPELLVSYLKLKKEFEEWELGILDENEEPHLAMAVSDCYFGAGGSLVTIYSVTGKPMMLTAYHYPEELLENEITKEEFYGSLEHRPYYKEKNINALSLFLENHEEIAGFRDHRLEVISKHLANLDGTVGSKIYQHVMNEVDYELRDYSGRRERGQISGRCAEAVY